MGPRSARSDDMSEAESRSVRSATGSRAYSSRVRRRWQTDAVAKRGQRRRGKAPVVTADYVDGEGNVLRLRQSLSSGTIAKIRKADVRAGASAEDAWRRRTEMMFERLAVSWEIAGLPLTDQAMLVGRYQIADAETQAWVRRTIATHVERHIPELAD